MFHVGVITYAFHNLNWDLILIDVSKKGPSSHLIQSTHTTYAWELD